VSHTILFIGGISYSNKTKLLKACHRNMGSVGTRWNWIENIYISHPVPNYIK